MILVRTTLLYICLLVLAACASEGGRKLPGVYRVDIQQGNIIDQEMIDKLKPGMDKNQVRFIMGTPVLIDPFHQDRWEYVYTFSKGGATREQRHLTLHFEDDKLVYVEGDVVRGDERHPDQGTRQAETVDVPLKKGKPGFFSRMFNALPFVGDEDGAAAQDSAQKEQAKSGADESGSQLKKELPEP